jgi:hypothetical protein
VISWEELRMGETTWDGMRDAVKKAEKTWDVLRWDGMTQTAVTVGCSEEFPREAAMRWDQMKWEKMHPSNEMAPEWDVKPASNLWAQSLFRSIGYRRFHFETSAPGLPGYYLYVLCMHTYNYIQDHSGYSVYVCVSLEGWW